MTYSFPIVRNIFFIVVLFIARFANAELTEEQVKILREARQAGYLVEILSKDGQTAILFGEAHRVSKTGYKIAVKVLDQFQLTGVEGAEISDRDSTNLEWMYRYTYLKSFFDKKINLVGRHPGPATLLTTKAFEISNSIEDPIDRFMLGEFLFVFAPKLKESIDKKKFEGPLEMLLSAFIGPAAPNFVHRLNLPFSEVNSENWGQFISRLEFLRREVTGHYYFSLERNRRLPQEVLAAFEKINKSANAIRVGACALGAICFSTYPGLSSSARRYINLGAVATLSSIPFYLRSVWGGRDLYQELGAPRDPNIRDGILQVLKECKGRYSNLPVLNIVGRGHVLPLKTSLIELGFSAETDSL